MENVLYNNNNDIEYINYTLREEMSNYSDLDL